MPVPVCSSQDLMAAVLQQLASCPEHWLLIWDERPLGALPTSALSRFMAAAVCALAEAAESSCSAAEPLELLQTPLESLLRQPSISAQLVPLQIIPETWSTQALRSHLNHYAGNSDQVKWAIVAGDQRPLGLLKPDWARRHQGNQPAAKALAAQNANLAQTSRLKSDFLAYISHEVKNPITALLGLSELLADASESPDHPRSGFSSDVLPATSGAFKRSQDIEQLRAQNQRQQRYIQLIRQNSRRLAAIANDMLDLSRLELGQIQLTCATVPLRQACDRAWQQCRHKTTISMPEGFHLDIQSGLTAVLADEQRLAQMLTELLINACVATAVSGEIGITIEVWGLWCAITVWDTGASIPPVRQPLLLQTLQPLKNPHTHAPEGNGIGLILTQQLAQLHGGDLTFVSYEGRNEFTLLLPLAGQGTHSTLEGEVVQHSYALALIVEAAVPPITELAKQLSDLGYRVAVARSGTEALQKIKQLHPQVIFLNPELPLLPGWDVLALIKSDPATHRIPVILCSVGAGRSPGQGEADAVLPRPSTPSQLKRVLETVIPHRARPRPAQASIPASSPSNTALTVLYFNPPSRDTGSSAIDFSGLLHPYDCRVLEVDDLNQGNLVAQVWKPSAVLLSLSVPAEVGYLEQFRQMPRFARLPMVVTDAEIAAAGHRAGLTIYPCLISPHALNAGASVDMALLVQVIRLAAAG